MAQLCRAEAQHRLGWARRDWLRGGVCNFTPPMSTRIWTDKFNHGPNSRGSARRWRKVASKSTSMHALLPTMSSIALETRANLIWGGLSELRMRPRRVLVGLRFDVSCDVRCTDKSDASEPQRTTNAGIQRSSLMCKIKNIVKVEKTLGVECSRTMAHKNLSKKASNHNPTFLWKRASKMVQQDQKLQTNSKTPLLKAAARLLTEEIRPVTLHVDTTPG